MVYLRLLFAFKKGDISNEHNAFDSACSGTENGTTMSRMIREYFAALVMQRPEEGGKERCRFLELAESANEHLPMGWRFNRSECYERAVEK